MGWLIQLMKRKKTVTLDCDGIYLVFDRMAIMRVEKKALTTTETTETKEEAPVKEAEPEETTEKEE